MVPRTRRRLLHGAAALLAGVAGCSDSTSPTDPPSPTEPGRSRGLGNVERDPDRVVLRASEEAVDPPLAWFDGDAGADADGNPAADASGGGDAGGDNGDGTTVPPDDRDPSGLVATEATAATLHVDDVEGAAEARSFVANTDFDAETVYLDPHSVGECYRLRLCSVTWSESDVATRYGRILRDHDAACRADARDVRVTFVRIPAALDPQEVTSTGSGVHRGPCGQVPVGGSRGTPARSNGPGASAASSGPMADATGGGRR